MQRFLHIGGLVAVGFDQSGEYLLTISHSGRGVFSTKTWERLAREPELRYPEDGLGIGIGPIDGEMIPIIEIDHTSGTLEAVSRDGQFLLNYEDGALRIKDHQPVKALS
jgi:hypothetical protein